MDPNQQPLTPTSPALSRVAIRECGEPLCDLREAPPLQIGSPPECPETADDYTWVRASVRERLLLAQSLLPAGIYLRLYEGYRSLKVQQLLFDQYQRQLRAQHPALADTELFQAVSQLVSPVRYPDGSYSHPPHATGGAVDIELVDAAGNLLDFGMAAQDWSRVAPEWCAFDPTGLSATAQRNRRLLRRVMTRAGFAAYPLEWWHFSYGDRLWAATVGAPHAMFGLIER